MAVEHEYIMDDLRKKRAMAIAYENKRENFLCKHCNILYKSLGTEGFVDVQLVKEGSRKSDPEWWRGRRVWIGIDLSQSDDNTAVAMVTEENGNIYARVLGFIPEGRIEEKSSREKLDYKKMISRGYCDSCGDLVIGYDEVERRITTLEERYGVELVQAVYYRYNAISTVQKLEA